MTVAPARQVPRAEYERRRSQRRSEADRRARADDLLSLSRLAAGVAAGLIAWLAWGQAVISPWWLAAPAGGYLALAVAHDRVIRARRRCERAEAWYTAALARLDHQWIGRGETGQRFAADEHLYAADLDLFGRGSLFELICAARTRAGEETLAGWLLAPAPPAVVRRRQAAVRELCPRLDLREDLALMGADLRAGVDPEALTSWAAEPPSLRGGVLRAAAAVLPLVTVAALAAWLAGLAPRAGAYPLAAALLVQSAFALALRRRVRHVAGAVQSAGRDLALLSQVLERLERERFTSPLLADLRAGLDSQGIPPSRRIARLNRLVEMLDARRNQIFTPVAGLLLWATQIAFAIERWRIESGPAVARWLRAVGELEALGSLAGYAYENPDDPFPEIVEADGSSGGLSPGRLEAEALGHPLIPQERCVRNDVRLDPDLAVLIVSGSNMSGKSTFLRAIGTNAVLALAGAPVRAARMTISPLSVGASIRIQDSLQAGTSRFYSEITRLRRIVDLARAQAPALFLIDEMLHGTNSHDRRIGAEAIVRGLVQRGAIGLITTHDLALAHISDMLAPRAGNVHFEDHLEQGRISFDYVLRPGVVRKSNALELMRAVGLDI